MELLNHCVMQPKLMQHCVSVLPINHKDEKCSTCNIGHDVIVVLHVEHQVVYRIVKSRCCALENNTALYANATSIIHKVNKKYNIKTKTASVAVAEIRGGLRDYITQ